MKSRAKAPKNKQPGVTTPPPKTPARAFSWRARVVLGLGALLAAAGTSALFEFVVWAKVPSELVGKWVVLEGPQEGATFDFFRNGTMIGTVNLGGKEGIIKATVRVEGNTIYATTRHPRTGEEDTRVQVIRTLSAKELVVEDEQGDRLTMKRVQ